MLTKLSEEHKITVSCMCSDHSKFTAGGSVSNHAFGRGLDIAAIDGEIVSPSSPLAREIASELSSFDTAIRPDEIGSPFAINGPGYFTDAAHMNHVHVGFKTELPADFDLPDQLAAGGAPAAPAAPAVAARGRPEAVGAACRRRPRRPAPGRARSARRRCGSRRRSAGSARPAAPTRAHRSTSTSRRRGCRPATRGAPRS